MTQGNGNGKSARVRAREIVAAQLAEAQARIKADQADLETVLRARAAVDAADRKLARAVAVAEQARADTVARANGKAGAAIGAWRGRGATEAQIADVTGLAVSEIRRMHAAAGAAKLAGVASNDRPYAPATGAAQWVPGDPCRSCGSVETYLDDDGTPACRGCGSADSDETPGHAPAEVSA